MAKEEAYIWDENGKLGYKVESDDDGPIAGEPLPKIESGEYKAICTKTEIGTMKNWGRKIFIHFVIVGGKFDGAELVMACNYPKSNISPNHKFYQQWVLANGGPPSNGQRLARKIFINKQFLVLVQNTKRKHSNGKLMADCLQYSVVDSIIGVIQDEM